MIHIVSKVMSVVVAGCLNIILDVWEIHNADGEWNPQSGRVNKIKLCTVIFPIFWCIFWLDVINLSLEWFLNGPPSKFLDI